MSNRKSKILWMSIILLLQSALTAQIEITASKSDVCLRKLTSGGLRSENVSYRLQGCPGCNSMEWDVGNGYQVTGSPLFSTAYTTAGFKSVKCKYKTSTGATGIVTLNNAVQVHDVPALSVFISDSLQCKPGDSITIKDESTTTVSRQWLIDGINYDPGPKSMTFSFAPNRAVTVFMHAKNIHGCVNNFLKDSAIIVTDTVKSSLLSSQKGGCSPASINFAADIDSGQQSIQKFLWTFENAVPSSSSQRNPKGILYNTTDTSDVGLVVTTNRGCTYSYKSSNLISLGASTNLDILVSDTNVCANTTVVLTNTNGKSQMLEWEILNVRYVIDSSVGKKLYIRLLDTGSAEIKVSEMVKSCLSSSTKKNAVTVKGPKALFKSDVSSYCSTPDTLTFTNTSIKAPGTTSWKWNIYEAGSRVGGGSDSNFSYITNSLSSYDVELIALGSNGCEDTLLWKGASVGGKIKAGFGVVPHPACPNQDITLVDRSENTHPLYPHTYRWTFYNGSGAAIKTSTIENPKNSYASKGSYDAKLYIENAKGCKDSITLKDTILVNTPDIAVSAEDTTICTSEPVRLFITRKSPGSSGTGLWYFENIDSIGNIIYRSGDTVSFITSRPGRWTVKYQLKDTSGGGCLLTYSMPGHLKVSGAYIKAKASPDYGCEPLNTTLEAEVISNWDYNNPTNKPIVWEWRQQNPKKGFSFADSSKRVTLASGPKDIHYVQVKYTTGSGCSNVSNYVKISSGVRAAFSMKTPLRCINTKLGTVNQSSAWATSFEYICDSASVEFLPDKFAKEPEIRFKNPGFYNIKLVAKHSGCTDTFSTALVAEQVIADFYSPDSVSYCAPVAVVFKNTSTGNPARSWWTFGDGKSTTSIRAADVGNLYTENNIDGLDISLIADNGKGCRDTVLKKKYVKVIGPIPDIVIKNTVGCEPLEVEFINKSRNFSKFFLDFDDGVILDSNKVKNHKYSVQNNSLITQIFKPNILLYDNNGCAAFAKTTDSVRVFKKPEGNFEFSSTRFLSKGKNMGCADDKFLVKFSNQSTYYNSIDWDLDGDGIVDVSNNNTPSFFYNNPGEYVPQIFTEYINGCRDTFSKDTIIALEAPVADFIIPRDSICIQEYARVEDRSTGKYPIVEYEWNFGQQYHFDDTASSKNAGYFYKSPFQHLINLYVKDTQGCTDQVAKAIYIADTIGPDPSEIKYVTVNPDNSVTFEWAPSKAKNFFSTSVYEEVPTRVFQNEFFALKDTIFSINKGLTVNTNRFCYTLQLTDTCLFKGKVAQAHCTILLSTESVQNYHNRLYWLGYDYWGNNGLSHYEIWRKAVDESTFTKISEVNENTQSFVDSFLCNKEYCYYIKAINRNKIYSSTSNRACQTPIYQAPDISVPVELVTVQNSAFIKVNWKKYPVYIRGGRYQLERAINNGPSPYSTVQNTDKLWADDVVADFNANSFKYRVKYIDHCGGVGPAGTASNSVYVSSPDVSGNVNISWTPYSKWYSGVKEYKIQYKNKQGLYIDHLTVDGSTTSLSDIAIGAFGQDSLCLRVVAVKDTSELVESISNLNCFVDKSEIWVPTAFTPNNDGKNDLFKVYARNVRGDDPNPSYRFTCQVYNRWGQKVYETFDFNTSWDGTFNGELVSRGLYIVRVYAVGFDGEAFRYNGTLSIER